MAVTRVWPSVSLEDFSLFVSSAPALLCSRGGPIDAATLYRSSFALLRNGPGGLDRTEAVQES
jgi:hypothetical protein